MTNIVRFGTIVLVGFAAALPTVALAQGFVPLAPIPGLTDTDALSVAKSTNLASFFNNLYIYLIGLAAVLAVIEIIWGGLEISTQDSVSKQSDGKERITQAIFGLVLVLSPVLVFTIINPSILNLSLNIPKLDTASVPGSNLTSLQQKICGAYSQVQVVPVPQNKYCKDVLGAGWVNIDSACAGTNPSPGFSACGLSKSTNSSAPQPNQASPEESFFPSASDIPAGSVCYQVSQGFVCGADQNACATLAASETSPVVQYCQQK